MSVTIAKSRYASGGFSNPDRPEIRDDHKSRYRHLMTSAWGVTLQDGPGKVIRGVPEWDDRVSYTADELLLQAERFLCADPKPPNEDRAYLRQGHLKDRKRREIYNKNGVPDPGIVSGIYNRSHPQGRKISTPEQRSAGDSFYR